MSTYYKDQGDGYYVVPEGIDVTIPNNWIEITEEEYSLANPKQVEL